MEYNLITAYTLAPSDLKMEESNLSVLYMNHWSCNGGILLMGDARRNSLEPMQLGMEDNIMNLIGVQDGNGSADTQNVFGMVSYLTGRLPILRQTLLE